ncbi:hypothetical protein BDD12DRAFT_879807 [Trichophaea hybrida]|nr:hypothetical protein BDD12DRAFT_879807 [Trichophaea hybrida]
MSSTFATPPTTAPSCALLKRIEDRLDKHEKKYDNSKDCFLHLQNNFFKKLENDDEATSRLEENDKLHREWIAKDKVFCQETQKISDNCSSLQEEKKEMGEELDRLRTSAAATSPPPPETKKMIRPTPTPVVPLAMQVLKRNLARKVEESQKKARPTNTQGQYATGAVEDSKRKREDGRARAPKSEEKPKSENGRAQAPKSEEKKKSEAGWTKVNRKQRPRGRVMKIEDGRGYTLVWDTPTGRYDSWRPKGSR